MSKYTINIGLNNPVTGVPNGVEQTLTKAFQFISDVRNVAVKQSASEKTVIIDFECVTGSLTVLSCALDQDCIALYNHEKEFGVLYGDQADKWGSFNKQYFLEI